MTDNRIYQIGLTMINGVGDILARQLLQTCGDAEAVFTETQHVLEKIPGFGSATLLSNARKSFCKRKKS